MATYFGYVEREADSYINWADVGRNMSATIDNIQRVRDEKKALIEKAYNEDLDYIQSIPSGEHKTLRDWSIGFGNDAAENLKLKYNLLKQGKSSVKDFTSFRENITNDTESLYKTINNIQAVYKEKMDRFKNDENMDLELLDMAQLERFGNLSDTKSFINGLTGSVGVGLTEEVEVDGKKVRALKKGDDAYLTVQQLVAAVNRKYDNYDVRPDIAKWVDGFGEKIKSLRQFGSEIKAGSIIEVMDITNEELMRQAKALGYTDDQIAQIQKSVDDFKKAEDLYLKGLMVDNPYHTLATLNKRLNYQPTFSKEEADKDPNKVYCERDSSGAAVPKFTPDQEKAVFDYMKGQARLMYDEKVKLNMYNEPTPPRPVSQGGRFDEKAARYGREQKSKAEVADKILNLKVGDVGEKESSINYITGLKGVNQKKTKYNPSTNTLEVYSSDPDKPEPFVYQFEDLYDDKGKLIRKKTDMSNEDFVFQLLSIAYPDLEEEYSDYLVTVNKERQENPDIPLSRTIRDKEKEIERLRIKNNEVGSRGWYDIDIEEAEIELENLRKKQAAQGKRQGQGGRTTRFNEED